MAISRLHCSDKLTGNYTPDGKDKKIPFICIYLVYDPMFLSIIVEKENCSHGYKTIIFVNH